ncbi:hypothetical protein GIB67_005337 [Kingdonia uniflora]|uniref:Uncharacterized protein n=1 Tax=Kingdonia uniflora TaxID=39325 RepID=A0A7J7NDL8_9MAGN|nr:hypothetical protein GIB67_005337 [Kingdonia uniflora]
MASISCCAKADEADLVGHLSPVIGVGDEEDTVAELIEWPRPKGSRVEYPTGSSRFREFFKAKSSIDGIWGYAFAYRGNFFRTCSVSQGGDYLYLLPDLAKEKKCRHLGDEVSLEYVQGIDFWEVIFVCKTLNGRWAASGSEKRITAKDFLEYYAVKYVTVTTDAYLCSSSARQCFFDLSSAGRVWNDNLLWVSGECLQRSDEKPQELNNRAITKGINCKVSRKESFIDVVAREGTDLEAVPKELEISRFKRVASNDDKVRRSQAKRRLVGKTPGSMEEKLTTSELNIPLKLAWLNEILDGPVDMATVSSTVVRNLAKRKAIKRGAAPRSVSPVGVNDSSKRRKFARALKDVQLGSLDRSMELEKKISQLKGEKSQLEEKLTRERVDFQLEREKEKEAAALKLKQVRAESEAEAERLVTASAISQNILIGKEIEEKDGGLNTAKKTDADNQETINQEIENSRLRVVDLEGLLEVEIKSSAELQLSLKLEEAKRQVEEKTATILSRDFVLSQLASELAELKEKAAPGSRHEAELAEYHISALNEEISDMKCNIRALNELLLKREIDLDTALDRLKADLRRLKGKEAQNRADLVEIQAKKQNLVKDLAHARGNKSIDLTRKMSERIGQLTAELAELKARRWKDNKRTAVTHQAFKELVVHEQEKCDVEVLHQRQLSALVVFFVEEIKFLQVERDLMQDCFSGRTCVCKHNISSIDPIGVMDRGIGTTTAEHIARGREIVAERAPEYMPSRTEIRGS